MRIFQIVLFFISAISLLMSAFFAGSETGDTLWRAGIAFLLFDVTCIMLWPHKIKA